MLAAVSWFAKALRVSTLRCLSAGEAGGWAGVIFMVCGVAWACELGTRPRLVAAPPASDASFVALGALGGALGLARRLLYAHKVLGLPLTEDLTTQVMRVAALI